jgi:hypothetical protein
MVALATTILHGACHFIYFQPLFGQSLNNLIKVERQLVRSEEKTAQFASPKTRFGRCTIVLGSKTIEVLRSRYELQHAERQAAGDG